MVRGTSSNPITVGDASEEEDILQRSSVTAEPIKKRKLAGEVDSLPRKEATRRATDVYQGDPFDISQQEVFKPDLDSLSETPDLEIPFELDIPTGNDRIRCRSLTDFTIYSVTRRHEPAPLCSLHAFDIESSLKERVRVTGNVSALHEDSHGNPLEDDEESEIDLDDQPGSLGASTVRVNLSVILRYTTRVDVKTGHCDIYLQTSYALYKLAQPSVQYQQMYFKFWASWQIMTYLDRLVLIHPQSTSEDFIAELRARFDAAARGTRLGYEQNRMVRYVVSWQDLADRLRGILSLIELYIPDLNLRRKQSNQPNDLDHRPLSAPALLLHIKRCRQLLIKLKSEDPRATIPQLWLNAAAAADLLRSQLPKPLLTGIVGHLVAPFFEHIDYDVITSDGRLEAPRSRNLSKGVPRLNKGDFNQVRSLKWLKRLGPHRDELVGGAHRTVTDYSGVKWGSAEILLGSTVLLMSKTGSTSEEPSLALVKGLRRVQTLREGEEVEVKNFAHLQFFMFARDAPELGEAASERELMLTLRCDTSVPLQALRATKKCTLAYGMTGASPVASGYFYRYLYESASRGIAVKSIQSCDTKACSACQHSQRNLPRLLPPSSDHKGGVVLDDLEYHVDDLVFIGDDSDRKNQIFRKAIVADIVFCEVDTEIEVILLNDLSSVKRRVRGIPVVGDELALIKTATRLQVSISCVKGKIPIPSSVDGLSTLIPTAHLYHISFETEKDIDKANISDCRPLRVPYFGCTSCSARVSGEKMSAADIYAGAGGLTEGARQTGQIDSVYAVEWDSAAACTLKANHTATVHCAPVEQLLKSTLLRHYGFNPKPVIPKHGKNGSCKALHLPAPSSITILSGGPPCQGFSGLNRFATASDERNFQLAVFMALVEWLQPQYVVLENVPNMLSASMNTLGGVTVEKWACKMVCSALLALGYQVRTQILCAADFGTPQSRRRAVVIAAKVGASLPNALRPSHAYSAPASRQPVTAWDSISDLPQWDYTHPSFQRQQRGLPKLDFSNSWVGYHRTAYATKPVNAYQQGMRTRHDHSLRSSCSSHFTKPCSAIDVERIYHVSNDPRDQIRDWRCVPQELLPAYTPFAGLLSRPHPDVPFSTTTTHHCATGKSTALHPTNHRLLTQREQCRRQGFDDSYKFCGSMDEVQRQIGNSVPPQLARAIFESIIHAAGRKMGDLCL